MPFHRRELILGGATAFSPTSIPGLQLWLKADAGLTLSTTGFTGTGTTVAQSGNTLTGVATKFLSECVIGDNISGGNGLNGNVTAIASDTSLTLDSSATIGAETPYTITPVAGVSDRVTTWADQSGLGNNLTQSTQSKKPSLKTAVQNGLQVLRGDGGDDFLINTGLALPQPMTMFLVFKITTAVSLACVVDANVAALNNSDCCEVRVNNPNTTMNLYSGASLTSTLPLKTGSFQALSITWNGASSAVRQNGAGFATGDAGSASVGANFTLFNYQNSSANRPLKGDIAEVLAYTSALSAGNIASVEGYLNAKWAIY